MIGQWLLSVLDEAVVAAALVAFAAWVLRKWIATRLTASIQLETDKKLHEFKTRLDAAEAQVSVVRQAGIDATLQLSGVVVAERVAAIKQVWNGETKGTDLLSGETCLFQGQIYFFPWSCREIDLSPLFVCDLTQGDRRRDRVLPVREAQSGRIAGPIRRTNQSLGTISDDD